MMSDGYSAWLGIAPEGKFPVRTGDAADPKKFVNAWPTLPAGVDDQEAFAWLYGEPTMDQIADGTGTLDAGPSPRGRASCSAPTVAELAIPRRWRPSPSASHPGRPRTPSPPSTRSRGR